MKAAVIARPATHRDRGARAPCARPDEVLIRVHACGVCHGDLMVRDGHFPFVRYPIAPGHEIAGTVEAIGERVGHPDARGGGWGCRRSSPRAAPARNVSGRRVPLLQARGLAIDGTMMVLGAPFAPLTVSPFDLIMGRRRLMGTPAGSRKDLRDTLAFAANPRGATRGSSAPRCRTSRGRSERWTRGTCWGGPWS